MMFTKDNLKKSLTTTFTICLLVLCITSLLGQSSNQWGEMESKLKTLLKETKTPGFSVAIVKKDQIIYQKGFGFKDYENKIPVDKNTLFPIGSITKSFTSATLGRLREEMGLSFDDAPRKYIPELKFYNDEMNSGIIIKDLMSHRTGLPRHDIGWFLYPDDNREHLLKKIVHHKPFMKVRQSWYYNNYMFMLQGIIVERIKGVSWEEYIQNNILSPLQMHNSSANFDVILENANASFGYEIDENGKIQKMDYSFNQSIGPAGSIISNTSDMVSWLITWLNNGRYGGKQILPESYIKEAMSSQAIVSGGYPEPDFPSNSFLTYGYGWFLSSYKGHYRVEHGGNVNGFTSNLAIFPTDEIGIVILSNQQTSMLPIYARNIIADHVLNVEKTDWLKHYQTSKESIDKAKISSTTTKNEEAETTIPSHSLNDYTGRYVNPGYGSFDVRLKSDSLFMVFPKREFYLKHKHFETFDAMKYTANGYRPFEFWPITTHFQFNKEGEVSTLNMRLETLVEKMVFERQLLPIDVSPEKLQEYIGTYDLMGTPIRVFIKDQETLFVSIPGQPEYELLAREEHKFSLKNLEGYKIEFLESGNGVVNEIKFIQPNGTFKATKK